MGRYVTWSGDVLGRYPKLSRVDSDATRADSYYVAPAEYELDGMLGTRFSTPFSSNNMTARDIVVDLVFLRARSTQDKKESARLKEAVEDSIEALIAGRKHMITDAGDVLSTAGGAAWSNTKGDTPIFGFGAAEEQRVDPDVLERERRARDADG